MEYAAGIQENARHLDTHTRALCDRVRRFEDEVDPSVRGMIATRVYRDRPDVPVVLKRAEILAQTLEQLEPIVLPEDRLIGVAFRRMRVHQGVSDPDAWRIQARHPETRGYSGEWPVSESVHQEMKWWKNHGINVRGANPVRKRNAWLLRYGIASPHGLIGPHTLPDHGILLEAGIGELRRRIGERLENCDADSERNQLRAMDRCLEGLSHHCHLCATCAGRKAAEIDDATLRSRLLRAADACESIADKAPTSFIEALQLLYVSHHTDYMDTPGDAPSFGRVDQLLRPFYEADLEKRILTKEEAFDLICHFIIKRWIAQTSMNMTVGGVDLHGNDATNDLSYMFLDAMEMTELVVDLSVRLHKVSPENFVRTVARVLRRSFGRPSVFNDDVTIEALTRTGVALEDARNYAPLGCVEVMIPGHTAPRTMGMGLNLSKVFELVLNGGKCLVTGDMVWDDVPTRFDSFEDFLEEYHSRVSQIIDLGVEIIREDERIEPTLVPRPWLTVLSHGGIESACDISAGQPKYNPVGVTLDGIADVANSLYALKRLAFEDKRISPEALRTVLKDNWKGHEPLRAYALNHLPRYGQDISEINDIVREETAHYAACFENQRTFYGGRFWPMIFGLATGMVYNKNSKVGAMPSGRLHKTTLAQSLQPSPAGPQGCITELLHSVASVDFRKFPGGVSNVQECDPSHVRGEEGLDRLVDLLRGFFDLGGMELSLNFLNEEMLRAAQRDPDRHRYLMVRLFGMSAQFVNLSPRLQENIIERVRTASSQNA